MMTGQTAETRNKLGEMTQKNIGRGRNTRFEDSCRGTRRENDAHMLARRLEPRQEHQIYSHIESPRGDNRYRKITQPRAEDTMIHYQYVTDGSRNSKNYSKRPALQRLSLLEDKEGSTNPK